MLKGKQTGPLGLSKYVLMKLTVGVYFAVIREIADVSRVPFILWVFKVLREGRTGRSRLCSYLKWGVECSKIFAELSLFELGSNRN